MWIIYRVTFPNGKIYIGQTSKTLEERKRQHEVYDTNNELRKNYNNKFHNALSKHETQWEVVDTAETHEEALKKEAEWITRCDAIDNGYNCRTSQNGPGSLSKESKRKIAEACGPKSRAYWEQHLDMKQKHSKRMKELHANGSRDEVNKKIAEIRRSPEQRKKASEDSKRRYTDPKKREEMAAACGSKPFLVYRKDTGELVGRFTSHASAYEQLGIPDHGHISTILKRGKGSLKGYTFTYE